MMRQHFFIVIVSLLSVGSLSAQVRDRLLIYEDESGTTHPVKNPQDWQKRRASILKGMQEAMGKFPDRTKTSSIEARKLETFEGKGFTRETVAFSSGDGDDIVADVYYPEPRPQSPVPAMLALHPTGALGKRIVAGDGPRENRQYALELAQRGYVVIAPDYPSFGALSDYDFEKDTYVSGTMKGIVNHMRSVDFLEQLDLVDSTRIGVIGHSLGGHNAIFVGVFDPRIKVIVSSCGWTPFHDYYGGQIKGWTSDRYMPLLRTKYQLDPDQVPFDFYELIAALAPRPFYSNSPISDSNFDVNGVKKAIPKAKEVYELFGAGENLQVRYPACEHDFPTEIRTEAYKFIDAALKQ